MRLSWTLSRYLAVQFLISVSLVICVLMSLVFIVDLVEGLRKFGSRDNMDFGLILSLTALKIPSLVQEVVPFTVLFGGMWTFTKLTRSHELVVARAAGVSVWQFLTPPLVLGLFFGVFMVTVFNPLSASMTEQFERLQSNFVTGQTSQVSVSATGLWLREGDQTQQSVIHALKVADRGLRLEEVIIFLYEGDNQNAGRIDAAQAVLVKGSWQLSDAWVSSGFAAPEFHQSYSQPTSLSIQDIENSFAEPKTMSFWELPRFIEMAESAGFSASRHRLYWHSILSAPLLICAMILIAATFSLRFARLGGVSQLIMAGVLTGFSLYFISDLTEALGISGSLPVALAAWAPTGVAVLFGTSMLFHLEDG